jgi:hypothetical protein
MLCFTLITCIATLDWLSSGLSGLSLINLVVCKVWHRDRAHPISFPYYESAVYGHVDRSVLLSFSCSGFTLMLFHKVSFLIAGCFCFHKSFLFSIFLSILCNQI